VDAVPKTAGDGALTQTVAEDIFEKAVGGVGELLPAVDESVPVYKVLSGSGGDEDGDGDGDDHNLKSMREHT
jgi:hypothetical protein